MKPVPRKGYSGPKHHPRKKAFDGREVREIPMNNHGGFEAAHSAERLKKFLARRRAEWGKHASTNNAAD